MSRRWRTTLARRLREKFRVPRLSLFTCESNDMATPERCDHYQRAIPRCHWRSEAFRK
jgi:hypothetical protein